MHQVQQRFGISAHLLDRLSDASGTAASMRHFRVDGQQQGVYGPQKRLGRDGVGLGRVQRLHQSIHAGCSLADGLWRRPERLLGPALVWLVLLERSSSSCLRGVVDGPLLQSNAT